MDGVYLDASVIVPTLAPERSSPSCDQLFRSRAGALWVSDFATAETASALSRLVRMGELKRAAAVAALNALDDWRVTVMFVETTTADVRQADAYVRRFELKLRTPDALHLALCARLSLTLATADQRLVDAAATLGVEAITPE